MQVLAYVPRSTKAFYLTLVLLGSGWLAFPATTLYTFDPPTFTPGQAVTALPGVTFPEAPIVFVPSTVTTSSPSQALRSAVACSDATCSSNANQMRMQFAQGVSAVLLRAGSDESTIQFCFPESDCRFVDFPCDELLIGVIGNVVLFAVGFGISYLVLEVGAGPSAAPTQMVWNWLAGRRAA